jgi:hypothetical protein
MRRQPQPKPEHPTVLPQLANITHRRGVCGQYSNTVDVTYLGQPTKVVQFVTGLFDNTATVHMIDGHTRCEVAQPRRYGTPLSPEWIRDFYNAGGPAR